MELAERWQCRVRDTWSQWPVWLALRGSQLGQAGERSFPTQGAALNFFPLPSSQLSSPSSGKDDHLAVSRIFPSPPLAGGIAGSVPTVPVPCLFPWELSILGSLSLSGQTTYRKLRFLISSRGWSLLSEGFLSPCWGAQSCSSPPKSINLNHSFCGSTESSERSQGLIFEVIETVSG